MRNSLEYLDWLGKVVGKAYQYSELLRYLHGIEFYSLVPNDDNRGSDGVHLRDIYIDEVGPQGSSSLPEGPCTVLEMLVGVAFRLEFDLAGGDYERPAGDWFWVLVDNLGLMWFDNVNFDLGGTEIEEILPLKVRNLLERGYESDGNGGVFPLKSPQKDQRKVEIWYQMSAWVIENYPI